MKEHQIELLLNMYSMDVRRAYPEYEIINQWKINYIIILINIKYLLFYEEPTNW